MGPRYEWIHGGMFEGSSSNHALPPNFFWRMQTFRPMNHYQEHFCMSGNGIGLQHSSENDIILTVWDFTITTQNGVLCASYKNIIPRRQKHIAFIQQILHSHFLIHLSVSIPLSSTFVPTGCKHARPKHHLLCVSDGSVETMCCHDLLRCTTIWNLKYAFLRSTMKTYRYIYLVFLCVFFCVCVLLCVVVLLSETREKHLLGRNTGARVWSD